MTDITKVGVVGAGLMGHGIAQVAAEAGYDVVLLRRRRRRARARPRRRARAARAGPSRRAAAARRTPTRSSAGCAAPRPIDDLADCDLVIEAITENLEAEARDVARGRRDRASRMRLRDEHVVAGGDRPGRGHGPPERFVGLHFFNPVAGDEARRGRARVAASDEAFAARHRVRRADRQARGRDPRQRAGFIVNRLLVPYMLDAIRAYEEGVGIDRGDRRGDEGRRRAPDGPADADRLRRPGHARLASATCMYDEFRERRFAQPPTLRKMLAAGWYGKKTGTRLLRLVGRRAGAHAIDLEDV